MALLTGVRRHLSAMPRTNPESFRLRRT